MEYLFTSSKTDNFFKDLAQIVPFMKVSKKFYYAGLSFMKIQLKQLNVDEKSENNLISALFVLLSNQNFQKNFAALKGRLIMFSDLIEIVMAAHYKSRDETFQKALNHIFSFNNHPNSLAFNELEIYEDPWIWIRRAHDRVFRLDQLPFSAEMYLKTRVITPIEFFNGICSESSMNREMTEMFMNLVLTLNPTLPFSIMISNSIEYGNIFVLEYLLQRAPIAMFEEENKFLSNLIAKTQFSQKLLNLVKCNPNSLDKALKTALTLKNLPTFTAVLDAYDFTRFYSLKWAGCKYLLSRNENIHSYYNHRYFIDTFIRDNADIDIFPLLMPIFDLSQIIFKEIFKRLIELNDYDFDEPKPIESSLIFHSVASSENYLELLPKDASRLYIGFNGQLTHVRDFINIRPDQIRTLLMNSRDPLELLYFSYKFSDLELVKEMIHLFDINHHFVLSLNQIALNPIIPNNMNYLKQFNKWNLLQVALIYQRTGLAEIILSDPRFNREELYFRVAGRLNAIELTDALIQFESESPYLSLCAHELEKVAELMTELL